MITSSSSVIKLSVEYRQTPCSLSSTVHHCSDSPPESIQFAWKNWRTIRWTRLIPSDCSKDSWKHRRTETAEQSRGPGSEAKGPRSWLSQRRADTRRLRNIHRPGQGSTAPAAIQSLTMGHCSHRAGRHQPPPSGRSHRRIEMIHRRVTLIQAPI